MADTSIKNNITHQYKVNFPHHLNPNNTLYEGEAIKWMYEVAYITAIRFIHQRMVTLNVENIRFLKPVY